MSATPSSTPSGGKPRGGLLPSPETSKSSKTHRRRPEAGNGLHGWKDALLKPSGLTESTLPMCAPSQRTGSLVNARGVGESGSFSISPYDSDLTASLSLDQVLRMTELNRIFVPTSGPESWKPFLANSDRQWKLGHSAMAVARCWEEACRNPAIGLPEEIAKIVGLETELILAIPEHQVPIPPDRRAPSQSDVFALLAMGDMTCTLAVEATLKNPFPETVGDWVKGSDTRPSRLRTLCEDALEISCPPPYNLRYQLFHRTASAIYESRRFKAGCAGMIIHSFSQEQEGFDQFAAFCKLFGVHEISPGIARWTKLPSGLDLLLGWAQGNARHLR